MGGLQLLDLCGKERGAIQQTVVTDPGTEYTLSFAVNAHGSCGEAKKEASVYVDGVLLESVHATRTASGWSDFAHNWQRQEISVVASGAATTIKFLAADSSCGCITLDDVQLVPAQR